MGKRLNNSAGFGSEEELVNALLFCIRRESSRQYKLEREVDAGVGLADVIIYRRRPKSTREIKLLASIPPRFAALLDNDISKQIRNEMDFSTLLGLELKGAERVLRQFQSLGLLTKRSTGISIASVKQPPFQTIISVEAKLSDWSRALVQAYRNKQFADESWVVLDHRFYKPALSQIDRFRRSGVSLASVDLDKNLYLHFHERTPPVFNSTKRWHAQAALARRVYEEQFLLSKAVNP